MLEPKYSLANVQDCLSMWLDCSGTTQTHLRVRAIKWIHNKLREKNELSTPDREEFHTKFYLEMKNK